MLKFFKATWDWFLIVILAQVVGFAYPFMTSYRIGGLEHALTVLAIFSIPLTILCCLPAWIFYRMAQK